MQPDPLGARERARGPHPVAQGRRADPHHGHGHRDDPAKQRAYVKRLAEAGVAGLGFGLGFSHDKTPKALVTDGASTAGSRLFEVPYPVPFIAITEAIFTRVVAEQYDTLQRAVDAEHVLTRAVMEGQGVEGIAASLAGVIKGWALLLDLHGLPLASTGRAASRRVDARLGRAARLAPRGHVASRVTLVDRGHHIWVQPVGAQGRVEAFLAVGKPEQPSQLDRIVAGHALSLFAIELAKSRAVADAAAPAPGRLLRRAGARRAPAGRRRPRARSVRVRHATRSVVVDRAVEGGDPEAARPRSSPTTARGPGAGSSSRRTPRASTCCCPPTRRLDLAGAARGRGATGRGPSSAPGAARRCAADRGGPIVARGPLRVAGLPARGLATRRVRGPRDLPAAAARWPTPTPCGRSPTRCSVRSTPTTATTTASCWSRLQAFLQHNARWETAAGAALRAPAHAAIPDAQGRGAERARSVEQLRPDGVLARAAGAATSRRPSPTPDHLPDVRPLYVPSNAERPRRPHPVSGPNAAGTRHTGGLIVGSGLVRSTLRRGNMGDGTTWKMFIGGDWVDSSSGETEPDINPATRRVGRHGADRHRARTRTRRWPRPSRRYEEVWFDTPPKERSRDDAEACRRDRRRRRQHGQARGRGRRQARSRSRPPISPSSPTTSGSSPARRGSRRASPPASTSAGSRA